MERTALANRLLLPDLTPEKKVSLAAEQRANLQPRARSLDLTSLNDMPERKRLTLTDALIFKQSGTGAGRRDRQISLNTGFEDQLSQSLRQEKSNRGL
jgi:hypothetical protein